MRILGCLVAAALGALAAIVGSGCGGDDGGPDGGSGTGSIAVTSTPSGAAIYVDGNATGQVTNATLTGLAPGGYTVTIEKECEVSTPSSHSVTVVEDQTAQASFTLDSLANTGTVDVTATVEAALIIVDGDTTAMATPATLPCVPEGSHTITVAVDGYASTPESVVVNVTAGGNTSAAFDLSIVAQSRIVLVDHYSNTSCIPCKVPEDNLAVARVDLGSDVFVSIATHLNFPSASDPFYLENAAQFIERAQSPPIPYMPVIRLDRAFGDSLIPSEYTTYTALKDAIEAAGGVAPSYDVIVRTQIVDDSLVAFGTVRKSQTTAGDDALIVAAIETNIHYNASNGVTLFEDVVRRFLPSVPGQTLPSLAVGEEFDFRFAVLIGGTWARDNLEAVAWVLSPSTGVVYQAGGSF